MVNTLRTLRTLQRSGCGRVAGAGDQGRAAPGAPDAGREGRRCGVRRDRHERYTRADV